MAKLDRYGGSDAWDINCEFEERRWRDYIKDKTCADCLNCKLPPTGNKHGWCEYICEYVGLDDTPEEFECEGYTGA